jgi:hypothetical protein
MSLTQKFWDIKSDSRKSFHAIQTIAPVSSVQWRPGFETQLAYSSLSNDFRIQIYDVSQPFGPLATLDAHENVVSGLVWKDSETIYSCSKDCTFRIHSLYNDGVYPSEVVKNTCMTFSGTGNLVVSMGYGQDKSSLQMLTSLRTPTKRSVFNRWDDKVCICLLTVADSDCHKSF